MNDLVNQTTTLPPSAAGSPFVYGWALFGLLLLCAGALAMILHILRTMNWFRMGITTPLAHLRLKEILLFGTIVLLTVGDIAILLMWREVSNDTMTRLSLIDRWLDGCAMLSFGIATLLFLRSETMMINQLTRHPLPDRLYVPWPTIRQHIRIGVLSALLAALVAFGKVNPG